MKQSNLNRHLKEGMKGEGWISVWLPIACKVVRLDLDTIIVQSDVCAIGEVSSRVVEGDRLGAPDGQGGHACPILWCLDYAPVENNIRSHKQDH